MLDFGSLCSIPLHEAPTAPNFRNFGFWILDFGFWILDFGFWILDFGFRILDFGFWISDFGFWILDFGFRISDFGFWILDFGFRILDFGFGILDFGFWILDFGLGAFSGTFFGCYIIELVLCTPTRVGGLIWIIYSNIRYQNISTYRKMPEHLTPNHKHADFSPRIAVGNVLTLLTPVT